MAQEYRWNVADHAAGYDAAAHVIHPHYLEIQEVILGRIARPVGDDFLLVDLGGGSGRLAEKFLAKFPQAQAVVVDQSESFLELAARRLQPFAPRGACLVARLQDDWVARLPRRPTAIVSMSAIHHLDPTEKQHLYQRCYDALDPLGLLLNGDEIRAEDDAAYLADVSAWAAHMRQIVAAGLVADPLRPLLEKWEERNVRDFGAPRVSGDDCHQTTADQLGYFCDCGFRGVSVVWQKQMWAVMEGIK